MTIVAFVMLIVIRDNIPTFHIPS